MAHLVEDRADRQIDRDDALLIDHAHLAAAVALARPEPLSGRRIIGAQSEDM